MAPVTSLFKGLPVPDYDLNFSLGPVRDAAASGVITMDVSELDMIMALCLEGANDKIFMGESRMKRDHLASVMLYTSEFSSKDKSIYGILNEMLRKVDRNSLRPFVPYIWLLMHSLEICPVYDGHIVYRGIADADFDVDAYRVGRIVVWCQFSSCAASLDVQNIFLGCRGRRFLFSIELTSGRAREISHCSLYPQEREVLLPPNTRLEVFGCFDGGGGLTVLQLKELPSIDPIKEFSAVTSSSGDVESSSGSVDGSLSEGHAKAMQVSTFTLKDLVPLVELTVDEVCFLLASVSLEKYVEDFKAKEITGRLLQHCDSKEALEEEGVAMTTARFKLLKSALQQFGEGQGRGVPRAVLESGRAILEQKLPSPPLTRDHPPILPVPVLTHDSTAAPPSVPAPPTEGLPQLKGMGFPEAQARGSLVKARGAVDAAIDHSLDKHGSSPSPSPSQSTGRQVCTMQH